MQTKCARLRARQAATPDEWEATRIGHSAARTATISRDHRRQIWATSATPAAVDLAGDVTVSGFAHSDGGLSAAGSVSLLSGAEYASALTTTGTASISPAPRLTDTAAGSPFELVAEDWRPGGDQQRAAGANYQVIDPVACTNGTWTYDPANVAGEIVYVACNVRVGTSATVSATIVAEGRIDIGGATEAFAPPPGQPALVSLTTTGRGPENWGNTRGAWPGPGRIVDLPDNDHWRS